MAVAAASSSSRQLVLCILGLFLSLSTTDNWLGGSRSRKHSAADNNQKRQKLGTGLRLLQRLDIN